MLVFLTWICLLETSPAGWSLVIVDVRFHCGRSLGNTLLDCIQMLFGQKDDLTILQHSATLLSYQDSVCVFFDIFDMYTYILYTYIYTHMMQCPCVPLLTSRPNPPPIDSSTSR